MLTRCRTCARQVTQKGLGSGGGDGTRGAGKDGVLDVLVMENIFYGHATSRIYDLKASAPDLQTGAAGCNARITPL